MLFHSEEEICIPAVLLAGTAVYAEYATDRIPTVSEKTMAESTGRLKERPDFSVSRSSWRGMRARKLVRSREKVYVYPGSSQRGFSASFSKSRIAAHD